MLVNHLFKSHPYLIWLGILISIIITVVLTSMQETTITEKEPKKMSKISNVDNQSNPNHNSFDIFISYSSKDGDWVHNTLKQRLLKHGFKVLTDKEFKGGSMSIMEISNSIENTRRTVAVMTPNFFSSDWTKLETAMAQTLDPGASQRKLVPILKEDCNIPLRLKVLHYRDLRTDQEWEQLIEDLI